MKEQEIFFAMRFKSGGFTKLDFLDWLKLKKFNYYLDPRATLTYAKREEYYRDNGRTRRRVKYLHREIVQSGDGAVVDHINGDGLDNTRENLRVCSQKQNCWNSRNEKPKGKVGYIGVYYSEPHKKPYRAQISHRHLGCFATAMQAALAYDEAAKNERGAYAVLNFGDSSSRIKAPEVKS